MVKIKQIEHVGILVKDLDRALETWSKRLGLDVTPGRALIYDSPGYNRRAYVPLTDNPDGNMVVFYQPYAGELLEDLEKYGEGLHHLCLEVEDLPSVRDECQDRGCEVPRSDYSWPDEPFMGGQRKPGLRMEWIYVGNVPELNNVRVQFQQRVPTPLEGSGGSTSSTPSGARVGA